MRILVQDRGTAQKWLVLKVDLDEDVILEGWNRAAASVTASQRHSAQAYKHTSILYYA